MAKGTSAKDLLSSGYTKAAGRPREASSATTQPVPGDTPEERPAPSRSAPTKVTYERVMTYLTPEQRDWLRQTDRAIDIEGLSRSDIMRLAISRLRDDVSHGLDLPTLLVQQAHEEAARFSGRRNRGLPSA